MSARCVILCVVVARARAHLEDLLAGSRAQEVEDAKMALAVLESRLKESAVVSPINGLVLRNNLEVGETAIPASRS